MMKILTIVIFKLLITLDLKLGANKYKQQKACKKK